MMRPMARFETDDEARRLGDALAALRRARGLSQAEAGARLGMTSQGWGLYEAGKRPGLFRPDVQRRMTAALGSTPEALQALAAGADAPEGEAGLPGVRSDAAVWEGPPPAARQRLQLSTDELAPWAASGVILEYAPGQWPRRDQGCVIETADGRRLVRLFERAEADLLVLRGGPGGLQAEERLPRAEARRVAAVVARIET
jgi:transcriptional regulator with XRE-family HTH domain